MRGYTTFKEKVRGRWTRFSIPTHQLRAPGASVIQAKMTSFATYQDLVGYIQCRDKGATQTFCYNKGDNGTGAWGDVTAQVRVPMVALPPSYMALRFGQTKLARGKKVLVWIDGIEDPVECECRDKGPDGVCDLNPAALLKFGFPQDVELNRRGRWQWA